MFNGLLSSTHSDQIVPFQLEHSDLRGRFVRLSATLDEILTKHQYPPSVARLTAEAATLACLLGSMLKTDGIFSLQAKGDGPVSMLVADYTADGALRAYANFNNDNLAGVPEGFAALLGSGYLAFTIDRGADFERYQGIVEIAGDSLAAAAQHYFLQSEQIRTELKFFSAQQNGEWQAAALCIQAMPQTDHSGAHDLGMLPPGWDEASALLYTLSAHEALNPALHPHDILFRLFHERGVRVYDTVHVQHRCRCGLERAQRAVAMLTDAEACELSEKDLVEVKCEFCSSTYQFTLDEVRRLREEQA